MTHHEPGVHITSRCGDCGAESNISPELGRKDRPPCPSCGGRRRNVHAHIVSSATVKSKLQLKAKAQGAKKPHLERVQGDDLYRKTGDWYYLERTIDRRGGRYEERIIDPKTGDVIRSVDEPLTEHRGRGSAKRKPR